MAKYKNYKYTIDKNTVKYLSKSEVSSDDPVYKY